MAPAVEIRWPNMSTPDLTVVSDQTSKNAPPPKAVVSAGGKAELDPTLTSGPMSVPPGAINWQAESSALREQSQNNSDEKGSPHQEVCGESRAISVYAHSPSFPSTCEVRLRPIMGEPKTSRS